jgi:hypothetical protein
MASSMSMAKAKGVSPGPGRLWEGKKRGGLPRNLYNSGAVSNKGWEGNR